MPKAKKVSVKTKKTSPKKIDIHYIKTSNYRTFHVDGVFGGITPNSKLYVELFLQRLVTPQIIKHEITQNGILGKEIKREGKEGIVREIEAGLIMDIETAKVMKTWLKQKIDDFEKESISEMKKNK